MGNIYITNHHRLIKLSCITGGTGTGDAYSQTSEFFSHPDGFNATLLPINPRLKHACGLRIDADTVALTGGHDYSTGSSSKKATLYNIRTGISTPMPGRNMS